MAIKEPKSQDPSRNANVGYLVLYSAEEHLLLSKIYDGCLHKRRKYEAQQLIDENLALTNTETYKNKVKP